METKTFDARGMACPLPVVNAKKESEEMTNGGTLIILVDNEIAVQNLTKFGNSKGFTVSSEKKTEKDFTVTFQIPENSTTSTPAAESAGPACTPDSKKHGLVAVLSSNTMGNGEEQLGKILMKSFIFALTKQDQLPEIILCYNSRSIPYLRRLRFPGRSEISGSRGRKDSSPAVPALISMV